MMVFLIAQRYNSGRDLLSDGYSWKYKTTELKGHPDTYHSASIAHILILNTPPQAMAVSLSYIGF